MGRFLKAYLGFLDYYVKTGEGMATTLVYLEDFGVVSGEATVIGIEKTEDDRTIVILDQTCFYPRGGGQDWDTGTIEGPTGSFMVQEVRLEEIDGELEVQV